MDNLRLWIYILPTTYMHIDIFGIQNYAAPKHGRPALKMPANSEKYCYKPICTAFVESPGDSRIILHNKPGMIASRLMDIHIYIYIVVA